MKKIHLAGFFLVLLVFILPFQTYALTNSTSGIASGGSTYTLTVIVDDNKVNDGSLYNVLVKLQVDSFGTEISDFHDIVLYAKIEGGTFIRTNDSSANLINTVSGETQVVLVFKIESVPTKEVAVSAKAFFRENLAWDFDPETTTSWFVAFTVTVKADFPSIFIIGFTLVIMLFSIRTRKRKKN